MTRLPRVTGEHVVRALRQAGFHAVRQRGSHVCLRHDDGRSTVVPLHSGETIGPGLLSKVLRDVELDRDAFVALLD